MRCTAPINAGYDRQGDLVYSSRKASKELIGFQFECRKCLPCRLNIAREKAIRCWHESKMHDSSIFLTLTYDEEHLESPRLNYQHFQTFMKDLRYREAKKIPFMVTGEYGELNKRPHWHALLFNFRPGDEKLKYTSDRQDKVYSSDYLSRIWSRGNLEYGEVTIDSAGYVARYAAKKLVHGHDGTHEFEPVHKTSSKYALGRSWIEQNYKHTFENGFVVLPNGQESKIPRYYVDWSKIHQPQLWEYYVTEVRTKIIKEAEIRSRKEELEFFSTLQNHKYGAAYPTTRSKVKETILKLKFKRLQEMLKL